MFRSYLSVFALLCLAAVVGCGSSSNNGGTGGVGGTGGSGGAGGLGGSGGSGGADTAVTKTVSLGCTNSVQAGTVSLLDWILTVDPGGPVTAGEAFTAEIGGTAFFDEGFLDGALNLLPTLQRVELLDLAGTVQVRSGATGDAVVLAAGDVPYTCGLVDEGTGEPISCDPANDAGTGGNTDCVPTGNFNPCGQYVDLPISDDCTSGGECDMLGKNVGPDAGSPGNQCAQSGFCITGALPLPMTTETGTYTANADATEILFGWDDENTGAVATDIGLCSVGGGVCDPANGDADCSEGTCDTVTGQVWDLPAASLANPVTPNGVRISAVLSVLLQCTGAVDSADATVPPVPDLSSPSPDEALLSLPVQ